MKSVNAAFFQNLQEIVTDPIFIGISRTDLKKEIETNMWRISVSDVEQKSLTIGELQEFLTQVIENRRHQVIQRKPDQQILVSVHEAAKRLGAGVLNHVACKQAVR